MISFSSIGSKLGACFALMVALVAGFGAISLYELRTVDAAGRDMRETRLPTVQVLGKIQVVVYRLRVNASRLITADTPALRADVAATIAKREAEFKALRVQYQGLPASPEEAALFAAFDRHWQSYHGMQEKIVAMAAAVQPVADPAAHHVDRGEGEPV